MMSCRAIKRDAAPENAKPIKNATTAAVDARTRVTCRSKGSSAARISEPNQKPSSCATTTPATRPNATNISIICSPLDPPPLPPKGDHALHLLASLLLDNSKSRRASHPRDDRKDSTPTMRCCGYTRRVHKLISTWIMTAADHEYVSCVGLTGV